METIRIYLENLFAGLPRDERISRAKAELLSTMEDKYNELKAEGKSENEAVGVVISEFGNIDELLAELGVSRRTGVSEKEETAVFLDEREVGDYLGMVKGSSRIIPAGILMCILAPASLIACNALLAAYAPGVTEEVASLISIMSLFFFAAIGVMLLVFGGLRHEKYEYLGASTVSMPEKLHADVAARAERHATSFAVSLCAGILLIFVAVGVLLTANALYPDSDLASSIGVSGMLTLIGAGVLVITRSALVRDGYDTLLGTGEHSRVHAAHEKREPKAAAAFGAFIWPVAIITFLIWGLVFSGWGIAWIVFPVAALLNGAVAGIAGALSGDR